jgi:hypothetical protein
MRSVERVGERERVENQQTLCNFSTGKHKQKRNLLRGKRVLLDLEGAKKKEKGEAEIG